MVVRVVWGLCWLGRKSGSGRREEFAKRVVQTTKLWVWLRSLWGEPCRDDRRHSICVGLCLACHACLDENGVHGEREDEIFSDVQIRLR